MHVEDLTAALAEHDADPEAVLTALKAKRHRRVRNQAAGGVAAVVLLAVIGTVAVLRPWAQHAGATVADQPAGANGCASVSLRETLAMARQGGASVILATGTLSGKTALDGQIYHEMVLRSVRTLSGPAVAPGSNAWVPSATGPSGPIPGADAGALWAPDGKLFAIAWPAQQAGTAVGPVLRVAPVVGSEVVFSSAGCWDTTGLTAQAYRGRLAEIPGSGSYTRAAGAGFHAVALTTVERLAAG